MARELRALEDAVADRMPRTLRLLRELVATRSVLGEEEPAQRIVEERLSELGFTVRSVTPDEKRLAEVPGSGIPLVDYAGRRCLIASLVGTTDAALALNGHVDVVSEEPADQWTYPPFEPTETGGRMYGRGTGDMKGGVAAMLLAVEAATSLGPLPSTVVYHSVIEEECTGNGALTALLESPRIDGAIVGEPTGGAIDVAGVGVIWARITLSARAGHAQSADERRNVIEDACRVIASLRELERELNVNVEKEFGETPNPYLLNVGALHSGNWPATTPGKAQLDVRLGFPIRMDPLEAQSRLGDAVARSEPSAVVEFRGFRARGYSYSPGNPVTSLLAQCHREVHGTPAKIEVSRATCDLRYFQPPLGPGA
ncbi:MAG: M20/M25/M40 family metallo-hydrolase, partial [Gaiellaceae bacterium]